MKFNFLGRTGMRVSQICMGCMTFEKGYTPKIKEEKDCYRMLDHYVDQGGNFFDMADNYPGVEEIFGRWLQDRSDRDQFVIASKVRFLAGKEGPNDIGLTRKHILDHIDKTLAKTHAEFIDLYQMHCWDEITPIDETLRAFDDLVRMGKIRYVGASNFAGWHITKMIDYSEAKNFVKIQNVQTQYSLLCRSPEWEVLPAINDAGIALTSWSPLAAGWLSGKYSREAPPPSDSRMARFIKNAEEWEMTLKEGLSTQIPHPTRITELFEHEKQMQKNDLDRRWAIIDAVRDVAANHEDASCAQVALAWLLAQKGVDSLVCGFSSIRQIDENLGAMELTLAPEELKWLDAVSHPGYPYPHDFFQKYGVNRR